MQIFCFRQAERGVWTYGSNRSNWIIISGEKMEGLKGKEVFRTYSSLEAINYKEKREKEGYRVYIYSGVDTLGRYIVTEEKIRKEKPPELELEERIKRGEIIDED